MKITTNFHTHTNFCDGKNPPEEIVKSALEKGFTSIGFSSHSYFEPSKDYTMSLESEPKYFNEITALKEKYKNQINIFCGIEQEYFSPPVRFDYDFIIGSVHSIFKDGVYFAVDDSFRILKDSLDRFYGGDFDSFAEDYFSLVGDVVAKTNADIIGHIDLISKYFERENIFYQTDKYLAAAEKAVKRLVSFDKPFEINTGAMSRGYRTTPYPSPEILKMIKANNGKIIFSSDCHDKDYLDFGYQQAVDLALSAGFTQHAIITKNGIEYLPLK